MAIDDEDDSLDVDDGCAKYIITWTTDEDEHSAYTTVLDRANEFYHSISSSFSPCLWIEANDDDEKILLAKKVPL